LEFGVVIFLLLFVCLLLLLAATEVVVLLCLPWNLWCWGLVGGFWQIGFGSWLIIVKKIVIILHFKPLVDLIVPELVHLRVEAEIALEPHAPNTVANVTHFLHFLLKSLLCKLGSNGSGQGLFQIS